MLNKPGKTDEGEPRVMRFVFEVRVARGIALAADELATAASPPSEAEHFASEAGAALAAWGATGCFP